LIAPRRRAPDFEVCRSSGSFALPAETPRYPSRDQTIAYFEQYANHFGLIPQFGEEVDSVTV
jgi:hypothetical protein